MNLTSALFFAASVAASAPGPGGNPAIVSHPGGGGLRRVGRVLPTPADVEAAWDGQRGEFGAVLAASREGVPRVAVASPRAAVDGRRLGRVDVFQVEVPAVGASPRFRGRTQIRPRSLSSAARFGAALAWSGDWLAVGAPGASSDGGPGAGLVRVYRVAPSTAGPLPVRLDVQLEPSDAADGGSFGAALAWSDDGQRLAVGAPYTRVDGSVFAGVVHVFHRGDGEWVRGAQLSAPVASVAAAFGHAIAWVGDTLVVGSPGNGELAPGSGRVFGYVGGEAGWELGWELPPPSRASVAGARYGEVLASDGARVLTVGMPGRDAVEVFDVEGVSAPAHRALLRGVPGTGFGRAVRVACGEPLRVAVGAPLATGSSGEVSAGALHVFTAGPQGGMPGSAARSLRQVPLGELGAAVDFVGSTGDYELLLAGEPGADLACSTAEGGGCGAGAATLFRFASVR